jgi:hypothetical protein
MPPASHCPRPQPNQRTLPRPRSESIATTGTEAKGHVRSRKAHSPLFRKAELSCPIYIQGSI